MRHRIDAGSGLVAVGAAVLLVSLFLDSYEPGLTAWSTFELVDLVLAGLAVAAIVGAANRPGPGGAMVRWGPLVALAALVLVAAQIIDLPPGVDGGRQAGAWLALAATLAMGVGSALAVASVSVTVNVRDRGQGAAAVDHRTVETDDQGEDADREARAMADRREGTGEPPQPQPGADLGTTQAFEAVQRPASDEDDDATQRTPAPVRQDDDEATHEPGGGPAHGTPAPRDSRGTG